MPPRLHRRISATTLLAIAALILTIAVTTAGTPERGAPEKPRRGTPAYRAWIIHRVFGIYGWQAVRVARCESGLSNWAKNGQYLGMFQMGSSERARYGHSNRSPWVQARAAHRYFVASGRDWSPWACKP